LPSSGALRTYPNDDFVHEFAHSTEDYRFRDRPVRISRTACRAQWDHHILIYIDGSCLNQNSKNVVQSRRAGCAVIYGPTTSLGTLIQRPSALTFRLENYGPDRSYHVATSNRAELRAATAALECQMWGTEGWHTATIATDSTYVVEGITKWVPRWQLRQWTKATGEEVANKDLWKRLIHLVNRQAEAGCEVCFWHVSREHNERADRHAKLGATKPETNTYDPCWLEKDERDFRPRISE
jgi:ribonuclease HI